MPNSPFRRLILAAALLVLLASGAVGAVLAWRIEDAVHPEVTAKLEAIGRTIAGQVGLALDYGIPFEAIPRMDDFLAAMTRDTPEIARVRVVTSEGVALYAVGAGAEGAVVSLPIPTLDGPAGTVELGLAAGVDAADTAGLLTRLIALALGGAVVAGAGMAAVAWSRVIRPLVRLRDSLDGMAGGDFAVEPPEDAAAEIGAVARQAERLRAGVARRHADFKVEVDEIALAQPDADRRADIDRLAAQGRVLVEAR
ncbi:MAG: hypothetical protein WCZ23_12095 [Rhodospirillaceae bacterium]